PMRCNSLKISCEVLILRGLTTELTGAGARRAQGTNSGHKNAEGMAAVGVHVELTVRLARGVEGFHSASACRFGCCTCYVKLNCGAKICVLTVLEKNREADVMHQI